MDERKLNSQMSFVLIWKVLYPTRYFSLSYLCLRRRNNITIVICGRVSSDLLPISPRMLSQCLSSFVRWKSLKSIQKDGFIAPSEDLLTPYRFVQSTWAAALAEKHSLNISWRRTNKIQLQSSWFRYFYQNNCGCRFSVESSWLFGLQSSLWLFWLQSCFMIECHNWFLNCETQPHASIGWVAL